MKIKNSKNNYSAEEIQLILLNIWQEFFSDIHIAIKDRFVDIGGNSLTAIKIISRIEKQFNIRLKIRVIFAAQSIEKLAKYFLGKAKKSIATEIISNNNDDMTPLLSGNEYVGRKIRTQKYLTPHAISFLLKKNYSISECIIFLKNTLNRHLLPYTEIYNEINYSQHNTHKFCSVIQQISLKKNCSDLINQTVNAQIEELVRLKHKKVIIEITQHECRDGTIAIMKADPNFIDIESLLAILNEFKKAVCLKANNIHSNEQLILHIPALLAQHIPKHEISNSIAYWNKKISLTNHCKDNFSFESGLRSSNPGFETVNIVKDDPKLSIQLNKVAHNFGTPINVIILSALVVTLYRHTWEKKICFSQKFHSNEIIELENTPGNFDNIIPIIVNVEADYTFHDMFHKVIHETLPAVENQSFLYMANCENFSSSKLVFDFSDIHVTLENPAFQDIQITKAIPDAELYIQLDVSNSTLSVNAIYDVNKLSHEYVNRFCEVFFYVLKQSTENPDMVVSKFSLETFEPNIKKVVTKAYRNKDTWLYNLVLSNFKHLNQFVLQEESDHCSLFVSGTKEHILSSDKEVLEWGKIFDETYHNMKNEFVGWNNTYDGKAFLDQEMQDWRDDILSKIQILKPRKLLEVGCGTGIIGRKLLDKVNYYCGIDVSKTAIDQFLKNVNESQKKKIRLEKMAAHEISSNIQDTFDVVILNSVIQYFPSYNYLLDVLDQAISLIKDEGYLFIGDIKNTLFFDLHAANIVGEKKNSNQSHSPFDEISKFVKKHNVELQINPVFFDKYASTKSQVCSVIKTIKNSNASNEMSLYRYDVIIKVGKGKLLSPPEMTLDGEHIENQLINKLDKIFSLQPKSVLVKNIPHKFHFSTWNKLTKNTVNKNHGKLPYELTEIAKQHSYVGYPLWPNNGNRLFFDYLFFLSEDIFKYETHKPNKDFNYPFNAYTNDLSSNDLSTDLLNYITNNIYGKLSISISKVSSLKQLHFDLDGNHIAPPSQINIGNTLYAGFLSSVSKFPDNIAVKTEQLEITYKELYHYAITIAVYLIKNGIQGELVAIILSKSWHQIAAVLGVLLAGNAYLPLDSSMPVIRLNKILNQSGTKHLIVSKLNNASFEGNSYSIEDMLAGFDKIQNAEKYIDFSSRQNLAYVIFTSGSTGVPKGIMMSHQSALNTINAINEIINLNSEDMVCGLSSLSFDLSVYDIFGTFSVGATLLLPCNSILSAPAEIINFIKSNRVTIWNSVPQLFDIYIDALCANKETHNLRHVLLSGDWISPQLIKRSISIDNNKTNYYSLGGATEGGIWSIFHEIHATDLNKERIPYGMPLPNQQVLVLNEQMQKCQTEVVGEIYIAGKSLAMGYLNNSVENKYRFIKETHHSDLIYRTGDIGKYLNNGEIDFLGRIDDQVKIRGNRVELEEIASFLRSHPAVKNAAVVYSNQTEFRLIAFIEINHVYRNNTINEIREYLSNNLPSSMLPDIFHLVPKILLSTNGKIDKTRLLTEYKQSKNPYELSDIQKLILSHHHILDLKHAYNMYFALETPKKIDFQKLKEATAKLLYYIPELGLYVNGHSLAQRSFTESELPIVRFNSPNNISQSEIISQLTSLAKQEFNLDTGPLFKIFLIESEAKKSKSYLLFIIHHLLCDGDSVSNILCNLCYLYADDYQYLNLKSINNFHQGYALKDLQYWRNKFDQIRSCHLNLPYDHKQALNGEGSCIFKKLSNVYLNRLEVIIKKYGVSLNTLLLTCFCLMLGGITKQREICIAMTASTDDGKNSRSILPHINLVLFNITLPDEDSSLTNLIKSVSNELHDCIDNAHVPYSEILAIARKGNVNKPNLPNVCFSNQNTDFSVPYEKLGLKEIDLHNETSKFDLTLIIKKNQENIQFLWEYNSLAFNKATIDKISKIFDKVLNNLLHNEESIVRNKIQFHIAKHNQEFHQPNEFENTHTNRVQNKNTIKEILNHIWTEVLRSSNISDVSNFFELGGTSLTAITIMAKITRKLGISLPATIILERPIFDAFCEFIKLSLEQFAPDENLSSSLDPLNYLTKFQKGIFLQQYATQSSGSYNIPILLEIQGRVDLNKIEFAISQLLKEFSTLTHTFFFKDGNVNCSFMSLIPNVNVHKFSDTIPENTVKDLIKSKTLEEFDLTKSGIRFELLKKENVNWLLIVIHHILADHYSCEIITSSFIKYFVSTNYKYTTQNNYQQKLLKQYLKSEAKYLESNAFNIDKEFWIKQLKNISDSASMLPSTRHSITEHNSTNMHSIKLTNSESGALKQYCQRQKITSFMISYAAFLITFSSFCCENKTAIGTVVSLRDLGNYEALVAPLINYLPLIFEINEEWTTSFFLKKIREEIISLQQHKAFPFENLLELLNDRDGLEKNKLFQTVLVYLSRKNKDTEIDNCVIKNAHTIPPLDKYPLTIFITESNNLIEFTFEYSQQLYDKSYIMTFAEFFKEILLNLIQSNDLRKLEDVYLTASKNIPLSLLKGKNNFFDSNKASPFLNAKSLIYLEENSVITYKDVLQRADKLAENIAERASNFSSPKIVILQKNKFDILISIIASIKLRGVFTIIESKNPKARKDYILDSFSPNFLIKDDDHPKNEYCKSENYLNNIKLSHLNRENKLSSGYVMFTSGTTGMPKGVFISLESLIDKLFWLKHEFNINENDSFISLSSVGFDAILVELLLPILSNSNLTFLPDLSEVNLDEVINRIQANAITILVCTPYHLGFFLRNTSFEKCQSLRLILCGGEKLNDNLKNNCLDLLPHTELVNLYGPTEMTIYSSFSRCVKNQEVTIGEPSAGTVIFIIDHEDKVLPKGAIGEIAISNHAGITSYLNTKDNENKFFKFFHNNNEYNVFKTGDFGFINNSNNLIYCGRRDNQIKLKGVRLSLEEIENICCIFPGVKNACAAFDYSSKKISLFVQAQSPIFENQILNHLKKYLLHYYLPQKVIILKELPCTENGKIDRSKLISAHNASNPQNHLETANPDQEEKEGKIESSLISIWKEALRIDHISLNDSFFSVGGDSLTAMEICAKANHMGIKIKPKDLLQHKTIENLIISLKLKNTENKNLTIYDEIIPSPIQSWLFMQGVSLVNDLNQSFSFTLNSKVDKAKLKYCFEYIFNNHPIFLQKFNLLETSWSITKIKNSNCRYIEINKSDTIKNTYKSLVSSLDIYSGVLSCFTMLHENDEINLIIVIHHLVIDAYSWGVLLNDIQGLYYQLHTREFYIQRWRNDFYEYQTWTRSFNPINCNQSEVNYWKNIVSKYHSKLPLTNPAILKIKSFRKKLKVKITKDFELKHFLTVLTELLYDLWEVKKLRIDLESHGRFDPNELLHLDTAIGWFTSIFPFPLEWEGNINDTVSAISDSLQSIPSNGTWFQTLKNDNTFQKVIPSDIRVNYLGRAVDKLKSDLFQRVNPILPKVSLTEYFLDFNLFIENNSLIIFIDCPQKNYLMQITDKLTLKFKTFSSNASFLTTKFKMTELQKAYWYGRNDAYLYNVESPHIYLEFSCVDIDFLKFISSWKKLVARHPMLRASVSSDGLQYIRPYTEGEHTIKKIVFSTNKKYSNALEKNRDRMMIRAEFDFNFYEILLICAPEKKSTLLINLDLLMVDHKSIDILLRDWEVIYASKQDMLPKIDFNFASYFDSLESEEANLHAKNLPSWIKDALIPPILPHLSNTLKRKNKMYRITKQLSALHTADLKKIANFEQTSISNLMLAIFSLYLSFKTKQNQFMLNVMLHDRNSIKENAANLIGPFSETLLLPISINHSHSFKEYIKLVQTKTFELISHDSLRSRIIQYYHALQSHKLTEPLAPIVFSSSIGITNNNLNIFETTFPGKLTHTALQTPHVLLDYHLYQQDDLFCLSWDYSSPTLSKCYVSAMMEEFLTFLEFYLKNWDSNDIKISDFSNPLAEKQNVSESEHLTKSAEQNEGINFSINDQWKLESLDYTKVEEKILKIINKIIMTNLNNKESNIDFLKLGISSFQAIQIVLNIENIFGIKISPNDLIKLKNPKVISKWLIAHAAQKHQN